MSALAAGIDFLRWWMCLFVIQAAAWPLVHGVFQRSPDRGLAYARPAGLLLVGFVFWLGAVLGLWPNSSSSAWFAILLVFAAGVAWAWRGGRNPWADLRALRGRLLGQEVLFLVAFATWTVVRMNNPEALGTEKPMELAFINAVLKSASFPPNDPWLSGYAISYYHFGYILVAMLAKLATVAGGVAFNLAVASWFGMAAQTSAGLLQNLLRFRGGEAREASGFRSASLLAPLMLLLMGNLAGLLEVVRAVRVGWGTGAFWRWLDILELSDAPSGAVSVNPLQFRFWWWWRASRVINDLDLGGRSIGLQPIDEFPAFSFVLGDLHPHVLALPFGLVVLGLAFELMLAVRHAQPLEPRAVAASAMPWAWIVAAGVLIGGLAFLNTWDFPIYLAICLGATWLGWRSAVDRDVLKALVVRWAALIGVAVGAYIPFYIGFASQAGGILPNLIFVTKAQQLLVMFAPLLIPLAGWLLVMVLARDSVPDWRRGAIAGVATVLGLFMISFLVGGLLLSDPENIVFANEYIQPYSIREAIALVLRRRLLEPGSALLLGTLITVIVALIACRPSLDEGKIRPDATAADARVTRDFILLLGGAGALLVLVPEFLYLRDQFGVRMNTIFKFYFQSWTFWSVAGAYALVQLWRSASPSPAQQAVSGQRSGRSVTFVSPALVALSALLLAAGLVYTPLAVWTKTAGFQPFGGATLDASAHLQNESPEDAAAIAWVDANLHDGPLAEAVGGQYSDFARVSTNTGIPTVLGWPGHEGQWRGGYSEVGSREADIGELYRTTSWDVAQAILERYGIRYVYYGDLERMSYETVGLAKFQEHLRVIYHTEGVSVFAVEPGDVQSGDQPPLPPPELSP